MRQRPALAAAASVRSFDTADISIGVHVSPPREMPRSRKHVRPHDVNTQVHRFSGCAQRTPREHLVLAGTLQHAGPVAPSTRLAAAHLHRRAVGLRRRGCLLCPRERSATPRHGLVFSLGAGASRAAWQAWRSWSSVPPFLQAARLHVCAAGSSSSQAARPNMSFNRTRYGSRPCPRYAQVHDAPRGHGRLPPRAG